MMEHSVCINHVPCIIESGTGMPRVSQPHTRAEHAQLFYRLERPSAWQWCLSAGKGFQVPACLQGAGFEATHHHNVEEASSDPTWTRFIDLCTVQTT